jgi:hypothetical protein
VSMLGDRIFRRTPAGLASPPSQNVSGSPKFFSVNCATAGCSANTVGGARVKALTDS